MDGAIKLPFCFRYATSQEGWHRQQLHARQHLSNQIFMAVRQGFAAVQKDPLKAATGAATGK
ncbi:MAG TPA: hypothetical protein DCY88_08605 [Cyanobacteria bacterium UBA11372]|nr:hypothetical protein [Cyanobacteria bacterium UBA11372]HBE30935.1 hypothetical protein [Cyanobacteria bacterium UBA11368]